MRTFFKNHGLSVTIFTVFLMLLLGGQVSAGRADYNDARKKAGQSKVSFGEYLISPHFIEATAENWESEFLEMAVYVLATAWLYQKGSAESKDPAERHRHHVRRVLRNSPWPVHRGGWILKIYEHSLSLTFFGCFLVAFILHLFGGQRMYNEERMREGERPVSVMEFAQSSHFWFQSFQNWQSEFLAIGSMVVLSIFLRETNSAESKRVETPTWENED